MSRKKNPILTATFCNQMENVRLALEVLHGLSVRFVDLDLNTGNGNVSVNGKVQNIELFFAREDFLHFKIGSSPIWYSASFEKLGEVKVIAGAFHFPVKDRHMMWKVGRSATDRWEEPLFPKQTKT